MPTKLLFALGCTGILVMTAVLSLQQLKAIATPIEVKPLYHGYSVGDAVMITAQDGVPNRGPGVVLSFDEAAGTVLIYTDDPDVGPTDQGRLKIKVDRLRHTRQAPPADPAFSQTADAA